MYSQSDAKSKEISKPILITQNAEMKDLLQKVKLVAKTKATVLIMGENGTGKEVLAQLIHYHSERNNHPMVSVNCGAIPHELVESELFGHEKGAFTGAHMRSEGCFELANKGTLFLDEIGEMPKSIQVKLLRAVETGSFRRVGGKEEIKVEFALISATNKVLSDQVKKGEFREDLYYRLNVIELLVPPLRERKEDIQLLVDYYNNYFADRYSSEQVKFTDECLEVFMQYDWPGNVRELKNVVERCFIFANNKKVDLKCIPPQIFGGGSLYASAATSSETFDDIDESIFIPIGASLEEIEKRAIDKTLALVDNNKTEAAKILGCSRKTLHNKLDKYSKEELKKESA